MRVVDKKPRERKNPNLIIVKGSKEYTIARNLIEEYVNSLNFNLDFQDIENELENLELFYGRASGLIIMAKVSDEYVGVTCLRDLGNLVAEIKRMYIKPDFRGKGLGRKMLDKAIYEAKRLDYRFLRLDAVPDMKSAIHLFTSKGFYEIEDYGSNPLDDVRFMEYKL